MSIKVEPFGTTADGRKIRLFTITNQNRTVLKVTDMGACWVSMIVVDADGNRDDVVLGLKSGEYYETSNYDAFGAVVGRNANRITGHRFMLNGKEYVLSDNDRGYNLHSGPDFYYTRLWDAEMIDHAKGQGVAFSLFSPDGDQKMPGNLNLRVSYVLTEDDSVILEYSGVCDQDTVINVTNHSYFNLGGHRSGSIEDEMVFIDAECYTPGKEGVVTTGETRGVAGTPFDFRRLKRIADEIDTPEESILRWGGYDHNFCLKTNGTDTKHVAKAVCEKTGRVMDIYTDLPGLQMYTGNFISEKNAGKENTVYRPRCGVAFETQYYPDAVNHPEFPSPVKKAGEPFHTCTEYRFSVLKK